MTYKVTWCQKCPSASSGELRRRNGPEKEQKTEEEDRRRQSQVKTEGQREPKSTAKEAAKSNVFLQR